MLVVPVKGDKIVTKDDSTPVIVSSFTNLKDEPAVYLRPGASREPFIYFSDIVEINGVRVEYQEDGKVFDALGPLKRAFNLPQPKDTIKIKMSDADYKDDVEEVVVKSLKLQSKKYGISRGLLVCSDDSSFTLDEILDVIRRDGSEKFVPAKFQRYYFDYAPIKK